MLFGLETPTPAKARQLLLEQEVQLAVDAARADVASRSSPTTFPPKARKHRKRQREAPQPQVPQVETPSTQDEEISGELLEDPLQSLFGMQSKSQSTGEWPPKRTPILAMASAPADLVPPPLHPAPGMSPTTSTTSTSRPSMLTSM